MKIPPESVIHLLHDAAFATLATHSTQLAGYPYATALPCVVDEAQRPLFCISALAEHTKNLLADTRASVSVLRGDGGNIQAAERMTLLGDAEGFEPSPELVARYLRYQPEAKQYLELDFMFFRFKPRRIRYIGGLGRMGWVESAAWEALPVLPVSEEAQLLAHVSAQAPAGIHLLGVDFHGIDYAAHGVRARQRFPVALRRENLLDALARTVTTLRPASPAV